MAKAEATVEELVGMIERGELRLPEMQRQYVWRSTRVRDLLDSLYRGYPSGAILLWDTDAVVPQQEFAVAQQHNPYHSTRLGGTTNRAISDKVPANYFPPLIAKIGHAPFTAQCIPTASMLLQVETYKVFLAQRRDMIAERLNAFLSTQS